MERHWDIFCRVIDNFGDVGVCWRLARQLAAEHGQAVRLWLDAPPTLAALCPDFDPGLAFQRVHGVRVERWREPFPAIEAADVVIEAFACELPDTYLQAMLRRRPAPCWINLEYLSAEPWVEACHGLASPHPSLPLVKHFFFPGFTPKTGGLLREADLLARRERFPQLPPSEGPVEVSLFCYDNAPVGPLLAAWASGGLPVRCLVPPGKPLAAVRRQIGDGELRRGNLEIAPVPFVPQADFDTLLWRCAINFVRGEDSFVRAQWAGRPFVWQIYPQDDGAHRAKLDAFLNLYTAGLAPPAAAAVEHLFHAWNGDGRELATAWRDFVGNLAAIEGHSRTWADKLADQADLASNLVKFIADKL